MLWLGVRVVGEGERDREGSFGWIALTHSKSAAFVKDPRFIQAACSLRAGWRGIELSEEVWLWLWRDLEFYWESCWVYGAKFVAFC